MTIELTTRQLLLVRAWYKNFPPMTPWFPPDVFPVRPGVYMVDQSWPSEVEQCVFSLWDGNSWYPQGSTPDRALEYACYGPIPLGPYRSHAFRQWRGLLEQHQSGGDV